MRPRCDFDRRGHPAGEVGFESLLIDVAVLGGFAGGFHHDGIGEEVGGCRGEHAFGALPPLSLFVSFGL